jgi:hypothetical protein
MGAAVSKQKLGCRTLSDMSDMGFKATCSYRFSIFLSNRVNPWSERQTLKEASDMSDNVRHCLQQTQEATHDT